MSVKAEHYDIIRKPLVTEKSTPRITGNFIIGCEMSELDTW